MVGPKTSQSERRISVRFPIERSISYRTFGRRRRLELGCGTTINISSRGILFTTETALSPGGEIEVAVSWPVALDNRCPLKLVARGPVVRSEPGRAAMRIHQYEFRTIGHRAVAV